MLGDCQWDSAMPGGLHPTHCWGDSPSFHGLGLQGEVWGGGKATLMAPMQGREPQPPLRGRAAGPAPCGAQTTNSGTSSWVRSNEKYLLVLLTGKVSWILMHCWAKQPLQ